MLRRRRRGTGATNSQAKGPGSDETLESRNAPKRINLSGTRTERINLLQGWYALFFISMEERRTKQWKN